MLRHESSRHRWTRPGPLFAVLLSAAALVTACDDELEELAQDDVESRAFMVKPYPGGGGCEGCGATDELSNGGDYAAMMANPAETDDRELDESTAPEAARDPEGRHPDTAECDPGSQGSSGCAPGLACLDADLLEDCRGAGCCTPRCDIDESDACPEPGQECIPWYEEDTPAGDESLGACGYRG